jgi:glutathione S-transferase
MLLIGMFDSPYVRRVAVTLKHLRLPFEHGNWSVGTDFDRIREYSPLGRVPVLVMDDGAVLVESGAILDAIDDSAGPDRALLPASGAPRREALPEFQSTRARWFAASIKA